MAWLIGIALLVVKLGLVLLVLLTLAAYLVLLERKFLARLQIRYGPNRAGKYGLLQPLADTIKMLTKEDIVPEAADRLLFLMAPAVVATEALLIFAVVPFGSNITVWGREIPLVIADLNVGLLYVFALASLGVYGVVIGGWAANSKYSLLGGIRGAAQMISYELSLGLSLVPIVMLAKSFSLVDIVEAQAGYPFIVVQPVAFVIFLISAMAETKRIPFDLPEAENELGAGYHTEYSGMRFGLFFLGEYVNLLVLGALVAVFFLGGWRGPWLPPLFWFLAKMILVALFMIWVRGTLPRLRYDQLMHFGWKVLVPVALVNIVLTGGWLVLLNC
ncbi:MAG: NADH-quinone oxidoreductase subunit NuoH [Deltaproteobacteria bacterium]|nr:NADH-quinone oxidoreductase subunit NuoH [Deltaproteobacteria bacterium]MBW2072087.1 NADH-quinone oxidoreductase subunit NuoH [Deltaproteobacteria bacterium]